MRGHNLDLVDFPFQEQVAGKSGNRPGLRKLRRVGIRKLRNKLPAAAGDELRGPASGRDEHRGLRVKLGGHTEHVAVERPTETLVGADQDDGTPANFARFQQRMA